MADQTGKDDDLLRLARERYASAVDFERTNHEQMMDDLRFAAGDQWPEGVKAQRKEEERPIYTANRMGQFVRQVTGDIRLNRPAIRVKPMDDLSDPELADVFMGLIRQIEHASDAQAAYTCSSESAARCGVGNFRINTEFADDDTFDQDIRIRRIVNPFAVSWDPDAQELTREDAKWCFVTDRLSKEEFKARYPEAKTVDFEEQRPWNHLDYWYSGKGEEIIIAEYWRKIPEKRTLVQMPDGQVLDGNEPVVQAAMAEAEAAGIQLRTRVADSHRVEMVIMSGVEVLDGPFEWPGRFIPIIPVWGEEIHVGPDTVRHGLVRFAKDPQRMYNFSRAAATEAISNAPKAPYIAAQEQIGDPNLMTFWKTANRKSHAVLPYKHVNGIPPPQRQPAPEIQLAFAQEAGLAADDMKAVTGIFDAALGARSNETSGRAILARQREGDVGTFVYIDNLARAIAYAGRQLVDLIPKIYDSTRVVRVLGEDDAEDFVTLNQVVIDQQTGETVLLNDLSAGKYDVAVTTGPSFTTKREEASAAMLDFIRAAPQLASVVMDLLAKNLDWPGADDIAERLRKIAVQQGFAEPKEDDQPQPPSPAMIAEMQKAQAEIAESMAKLAETQAKTEGQELENAQKALELSLQSGTMQQIVTGIVQQALAEFAQGVQIGSGEVGLGPNGQIG